MSFVIEIPVNVIVIKRSGKKMRCRNWNVCRHRTRYPQNHMCWRMWQLCGDCAVREHREAYIESYAKIIISKLKIRSKNVTAL